MNTKLENFIERIKEDYFYGGIIEIGIISTYYDLNISAYCTDINDTNQYAHFTKIWKDENINQFMILHYNERIEHFSVLSINDNPNEVSNNPNIFNKTKPNFKLIFNDIKDK